MLILYIWLKVINECSHTSRWRSDQGQSKNIYFLSNFIHTKFSFIHSNFMPNFTFFDTLFLCVWLQVINKVKATHQGLSKISTSLQILCSPCFLQAGGLHSTECVLVYIVHVKRHQCWILFLIAPLHWEGSYLLFNFLNKPSSCCSTNCVNIASWFTTFHLSLAVHRLLGSFDPKSKAYDKKDIFHALFGVFINETACERSIVNGFTGMMDLTTFTLKHNSIWSMDDLKRTGDMMNVSLYSL